MGKKRAGWGFTLIELLVVIAIIGILASFAIASFTSAQAKGRDSRRKADLDAIKKALELFKGDTKGGAFYPYGMDDSILTVPGYMKVYPHDPSSSATSAIYYTYITSGGACTSGSDQTTTANCTSYTLTACLENNNDPVGGYVLAKPTAPAPGSACTGTKIYQVSPP